MPSYKVKLSREEREGLGTLIQKGGKGYRIRHAQILLKLDKIPENKDWTYDRITGAYGSVRSTIAGIAKRFVFEGLEAALGRKTHNRPVLKPEFKIVKHTNQRNTQEVLPLFVTISCLKDLKSFDTTVDMLYEYPEL
jgi:hypothetical protein